MPGAESESSDADSAPGSRSVTGSPDDDSDQKFSPVSSPLRDEVKYLLTIDPVTLAESDSQVLTAVHQTYHTIGYISIRQGLIISPVQ